MPTNQNSIAMTVASRRVFRLSFTLTIALAVAYGMGFSLPFLAPLFAIILGAKGNPPPAGKGLIGLLVVVFITMGIGLFLTPLLNHYPEPALLIIALGVYLSIYLTVGKGKILVGMFLTVGLTMITAAGTVDQALAIMVIQALAQGIALAVISHWVVYPFFPEASKAEASEETQPSPEQAFDVPPRWLALRATLVVFPAYLLTLTNPLMYLAVIMKTVNLGQQASLVNARDAGRELLGSTFMGGLLAILFWFALDLVTNLWMFSLWMLLFGFYIASKLSGVLKSRFTASFWQNAGVTMLILLGPAVEDSATGKDVYAAFFVRMGLFIGVTLYAWLAIVLLESIRHRRLSRRGSREVSQS